MLSPRAVAHATALCLPALLAAGLLASPVAAGEVQPGDESVRLVVRTDTRAGTSDVADAVRDDLADRGATPAGRVRKLRAVFVEVPRSEASGVAALLARREGVTSVTVAHRRWLTSEPADPGYVDQRVYFDAIRAPAAWGRANQGAADVRIAVVDSGVDVTHPDLSSKIAGTYNAINRTTDVRDVVGHGTGVASVAAASTNNGLGMAGAGYNSTLLVAKVADVAGRIFTDDLAAGVVWAADSGADVINLSLGGPSSDDLERDAIAYAQRKGVLVVAAAGNDGTSARQFPGALPGVLAVGATTVDGSARAGFSSFGPWVDVAAPGRSIVVATPGGGYTEADGTSFASPLVAGQVALLKAYQRDRTAEDLAAAVKASTNSARLGFSGGVVNFDRSLDLLRPATVPTFTYPGSGATIEGMANFAISSNAPKVRLTLGNLTQVLPVSGGAAHATVETFGLRGPHTVTVSDCSAIGQCAPASSGLEVLIANPAPAVLSPVEGSDASADRLTLTASGSGGAVRFVVDGRPAAVDVAAPFSAVISTEDLADGSHVITAQSCRSDASVCDSVTSVPVTVTTDRLHPSAVAVRPGVFSPGADGRRDTTTLTYDLPARQEVTFRVRSATGSVIRTRALGEQPAGRHTIRWDGRVRGGSLAATGSYVLEIATRDGGRSGLASRAVQVDRTAPRISKPRRNLSALFPAVDGYRDRMTLRASTAERTRWVRLEVTGPDRRRHVVAVKRSRAPGPVQLRWNGRTASGARLAAGTYAVRVAARDLAGNETRSAAVRVSLSGKQLVKRRGVVRVSAKESMDIPLVDECSMLFKHTDGPRRGWMGYYSSGTCRSSDAYAVGEHQWRLPPAAAYGTVRIDAYGGRADPRYRDSAQLTYFDRRQNLSALSAKLLPATGVHQGPRVRARRVLFRHRVLRWEVMTTDVGWYDVREFTIRYTYFVLR